ncbi:MAG TPA: hypothetical protein VMS16_11520 [Mycobacterium sp.]|jgi:hypothetical protein|nr:hypothetical protein [Mycobacterium sp.]
MAGPHSTNYGLAADGPPYRDPHPSQPLPTQPIPAGPVTSDPASLSAAYPGQLPPPVQYPQNNRRPLVIGVVVALVLVAAMSAAIALGSYQHRPTAEATLSDATAKAAIQNYLVALQKRDTDAIARNMLCGIYDAVRDRRSDQALAKLSSDAFRRQFGQAQVTSIDKVVYLSSYQTQVLFTMQVKPSAGGPARQQVQGLAQLLLQHGQILVCSYVLRTAGAY